MASEWWTPVASMVGVIVGGGLTFLTQRTTQRSTERSEERKRLAGQAEARRAEQIDALTEFIRFTLQAEGVAHARPDRWEVGDEWYRTARPAMDGLRIAEKRVELLCHPSLQKPAAGYTRALNQAVWQDRDGVSIADQLDDVKSTFLTVARQSLGSGPTE